MPPRVLRFALCILTLLVVADVWYLSIPADASSQCLKVGEKRTVYGVTEICRPVSGGLRWVKLVAATTVPTVRPSVSTKSSQPKQVRPKTVNTTTMTTIAPVPHGKKLGTTTLWSSRDGRFAILINAYNALSDDRIVVAIFAPTALSIDPRCLEGTARVGRVYAWVAAPIIRIETFFSSDGRQSWRSLYQNYKPNSWYAENPTRGCSEDWQSILELYSGGYWRSWPDSKDPHGPLIAPPAPAHVKFTFENLRTGEFFESPSILVDPSAIP